LVGSLGFVVVVEEVDGCEWVIGVMVVEDYLMLYVLLVE